jgi:hypothetical protein
VSTVLAVGDGAETAIVLHFDGFVDAFIFEGSEAFFCVFLLLDGMAFV